MLPCGERHLTHSRITAACCSRYFSSFSFFSYFFRYYKEAKLLQVLIIHRGSSSADLSSHQDTTLYFLTVRNYLLFFGDYACFYDSNRGFYSQSFRISFYQRTTEAAAAGGRLLDFIISRYFFSVTRMTVMSCTSFPM